MLLSYYDKLTNLWQYIFVNSKTKEILLKGARLHSRNEAVKDIYQKLLEYKTPYEKTGEKISEN